jgi:hypothetical protein
MALHDPVITLDSVSESSPNRFGFSFRLVIPDDTVGFEGIDETLSIVYRQGKAVNVYADELTAKMQVVIDKYKREKALKSNAQVPTFINTVKARLVM